MAIMSKIAEARSRRKAALARGAQKASDAGKGNSKRLTGYYVEKPGTNEFNVVKKREAKPFVKAEKKAAKTAVKSAAKGVVNRSQSVAGKSANPAGKASKKVAGGTRKLSSATTAAKEAGMSTGGIKRAVKSGTKAGYKSVKKTK